MNDFSQAKLNYFFIHCSQLKGCRYSFQLFGEFFSPDNRRFSLFHFHLNDIIVTVKIQYSEQKINKFIIRC